MAKNKAKFQMIDRDGRRQPGMIVDDGAGGSIDMTLEEARGLYSMMGERERVATKPPYLRETGFNLGDVLLFGEWDVAGSQIAKVQGISRKTAAALGTQDDEGPVALMVEALLELPESLVAPRAFVYKGIVWIAKDERLPVPATLGARAFVPAQYRPANAEIVEAPEIADDVREGLVDEYVLGFLPDALIDRISNAAVAIGVPEIERAASEEGAKELPLAKPSSGSSESEEGVSSASTPTS